MDELPDKVIRIDVLRVEYGIRKMCKCFTPRYTIDYQNKLVYCSTCNAIIDPFEALCKVADHWETVNQQAESLLKQRKEIESYKPWLLVFRDLESKYRSKEMLPRCPECGKAFYFEHVKQWTNRRMKELRRQKEAKVDE